MKLFWVMAIVAVLGVTGAIKFEFFAGTVSAGPSPAVRDAMLITSAAGGTDAVAAVAHIRALLDVARGAGSARGSALIRQQLPALAAAFDRAAPTLHGSLLMLNLKTRAGRSCRDGLMRLVALEQFVLRTYNEDVALQRQGATKRFSRRWTALGRWWIGRLNTCIASLPPAERADFAHVLVG